MHYWLELFLGMADGSTFQPESMGRLQLPCPKLEHLVQLLKFFFGDYFCRLIHRDQTHYALIMILACYDMLEIVDAINITII